MSDVNRHDEIQGELVHVYDDIEEADNNLPVWWLITFYGAIAFGAAYWFYYHELGMGTLPREEYDQELAAAAAEQTVVSDESLTALLQDQEALSAGKEIFMTQCVACHDTQGQGREGLGPNLTDRYWIHGGAPTNIHATIVNGIAAKGMPPWQPILGDRGVEQVTAYILTLRNTEIEGKPPEGDLWDPSTKPAPSPMGDLPRDDADQAAGDLPGDDADQAADASDRPRDNADDRPRDDTDRPRDGAGQDGEAAPDIRIKALPFTKEAHEVPGNDGDVAPDIRIETDTDAAIGEGAAPE